MGSYLTSSKGDYPYLDTVIYDNFYEMLKGRYESSGGKIAIRYRKKDDIIDISYAQLAERVAAIYAYYRQNSISGKHIGIISENRYEYILIYLATLFDNVIVPLDKEMTAEDLAVVIRSFDIDILFYTDKTEKKLRYAEDTKCINLDKDSYSTDSDVQSFFEQVKDTDKDRFAILASTSGTDGRAKGVMLSQYNVITNIRGTLENNILKDTTLAFLPMNHTYGFNPCILATLYNGTTLCLNTEIKHLLRDIRCFDPFFFGAVPMVIEGLYDGIMREAKKSGKDKTLRRMIKISNGLRRIGIDLRHLFFGRILSKRLRLVVSGGAALDAEYVKRFDELGITILNGYGLTECSPTIAVSRTLNNVAGSAGTIMKHIDVSIAEDGEILVKGPCVMLGYYKDEAATAQCLKDDYFATGDIGYTDGKVIYVTGRKKNLIILENGKNVSPEYLESRINAIPFVKESMVFPKKKNGHSSIIFAQIVLNDGLQGEGLKEAVEEINSSLPYYMRIDDWEIREEPFARNSSAKIVREQHV